MTLAPDGGFAGTAHSRTADEVLTTLGVVPTQGLEMPEVARRAAAVGPNVIQAEERPRLWRMILDAATEPFVLLLLASGIGAVLLGEVRDGLLVIGGLIPIVGADVITEYRGERALEALRAASAPTARVRREGTAEDIPAAGLVPGDVVLLRAGDVVPADVRLLKVEQLVLDRSVLTGESVPEPAGVEPDSDAELADRRAVAYAGTSVVGGRGEGVVVAIGGATEVGRIAGGLRTRERTRSPLPRELDRLVRILLVVAVGLIAITSGLGFVRGNPLGANLLAGISAAIAAIPEEPPVLLAVILGLGAYRLLKRGVLVRRLNAEEILGAVDVIITDKTGTLTQNRLEVASLYDARGRIDGGDARRLDLLILAVRAEDDAWRHGEGHAMNSFTSALVRAVDALGGSSTPDPTDLITVEPIDSGHPFVATTARRDGLVETLFLGAPEVVADLVLARDDPERPSWIERTEAATQAGERVVGLARQPAGSDPGTMLALIGFADPVRPGIRDAVDVARGAGIHAIVVTGDHPSTAGAIARQAGLDGDSVVLGSTVDAWSDEDLAAAIGDLTVVARSTPDQKRRLVESARQAGRLVAVTGDGVNDAPALHAADVAVAMGSGTSVAKEASDLVLGDDSFATLVYGIREGRRIVDNVQKGLVFLVSTHVALLGFILIATLAGFGQPLLPIQILWLELFIDTTTSVAFEREPAEPDVMRRPPRPVARPLLTAGLLARIAGAGGFSAVAALVLIAGHGGSPDHARWLAYTALVCAQAVRAYANRSLREPVHRLGANRVLLGACLLTVVVQAIIPTIPPLADAFRATPLDGLDWLLVAVIALAPAVVGELVRMRWRGLWVA
jgi:Ca2+-transporting ATPase